MAKGDSMSATADDRARDTMAACFGVGGAWLEPIRNEWGGLDFPVRRGIVRVNPAEGDWALGVELFRLTERGVCTREARLSGTFTRREIRAVAEAMV